MDKTNALALFYAKNGIDPARVSDPLDGCYDPRLAELPERVDQWLSRILPVDRPAFLTLLSQYTYLNRPQCQLRCGEILNMLEDKLSMDHTGLSSVLFVTVEAGGASSSGGDNVRADLRFRNLNKLSKRQVIAAQSRLKEDDLAPYQAVLFLDDIVGSGITLWGSIQDFCERFPSFARTKRLFYASIAPRERGLRHIDENCKARHIQIERLCRPDWIQPSAFSINSDLYRRLEPYEQMVGSYMAKPDGSFFMGYQKNRLLLSFYYNTPNNTLSTFWRIGRYLSPPFCRDGDQVFPAPPLADLKARKARMRAQAYAFGADRGRKEHECRK